MSPRAYGCANADINDGDGAVPGICLFDNPAKKDINTLALQSVVNTYVEHFCLQGRTLKKNGEWNTLVLPFNITQYMLMGPPLEGLTLKQLDNSADGTSLNDDGMLKLKFKKTVGIQAGTPYIVKWDNSDGDIENPTFTHVEILSAVAKETISNDGKVKFVGQYDPFAIDANNKDEMLFIGSGNRIGYVATDATLPRLLKSCRAHFQIDSNGNLAHARTISIDWGDDDETTSLIENGKWKIENYNATEWFTLDGRKLDTKPTAKGVYIYGGRKFVIK